jgi:hypothetical protein
VCLVGGFHLPIMFWGGGLGVFFWWVFGGGGGEGGRKDREKAKDLRGED